MGLGDASEEDKVEERHPGRKRRDERDASGEEKVEERHPTVY